MKTTRNWSDSETDGCCKMPATNVKRLCWITPSSFSEALEQGSSSSCSNTGIPPLVLDMRSFNSFNTRHVKSAHSLCFSPILLRRMVKGFINLDTLVTDPQLFSAMESARMIVLYDSNSRPGNVREELLKFSELLTERFATTSLRILLGGMDNFEGKFPHHCITRKALSPTAVTLDTSTLERKERPGIPEGKPVEVLPHLYLGSAKDSSNIDNLRAMGITAILNITTNCPNLFESEFEYMSIHEEDSPHTDLLSRINQAIQFIDNIKDKGGRVFVHCHAGISRSATVCIAYVMLTRGLSAHEAYQFVKSKRPIISPNLSFMGQLIQFEQELVSFSRRQQSSSSLVESMEVTSTTATIVTKASGSLHTKSVPSKQQSDNSLFQSVGGHFPFSSFTCHTSSEFSNDLPVIPDHRLMTTGPSHATTAVRSPPKFTEMERSYSTPATSTKRKPEGLRLSLNLQHPVRKSSQLSPCRVEACTLTPTTGLCNLSQSLNLPNTTCT